MKASRIALLMLALAVAGVLGSRLLRPPEPTIFPRVAHEVPTAAPPSPVEQVEPPAPAVPAPAVVVTAPGVVEARPEVALEPPVPAPQKPAATVAKAPRSKKPPIQDPLARDALSWVGADPAAEAYWFEAINDPYLPPGERSDLIEDLNEDGFTNPKRPTPDDLPLIISRIVLIERIAGDAMDQVNADAFAEAYKDLVNLYDRLTR